MKCSIYALVDPRKPSEYKYIGKTTQNIKFRLADHSKPSNLFFTPKCLWIKSLLAEGVRPEIVLLEEVSFDVSEQKENEYIKIFFDTITNVMKDSGRGEDNPAFGKLPWNKGKTGIYQPEVIKSNKVNQPLRKIIIRTDLQGKFVDEWISIRELCRVLGYDRRQAQRVLNNKKNFNTIKKIYKLTYATA